jgi:uncharacterized protein YecE (DUF72 family)
MSSAFAYAHSARRTHFGYASFRGMERIRIGCSGWNYKHWRELFYPKGLPPSRWFAFYAETFDTVEINNSFYMLPKAEVFDKCATKRRPAFAMR